MCRVSFFALRYLPYFVVISVFGCVQPESVGEHVSGLAQREATDPVQARAGEGSIDAFGNARYSMRLTLPPGRMGVAPEISLTYSSRAGQSELGPGFGLSGVHSSLHRCGQTVATDGSAEGVRFDERDRLCLDGERLIGAEDSNAYWRDGARYEEELSAWRRIVHEDGAERRFIVQQRDGSRRIYGGGSATVWAKRGERNAQGVLVNASDVELEWRLSRVEDVSGNYVAFDYTHEEDADGTIEHRLSSIRYTGGPDLSPERELRFVYERRPYSNVHYVSGTARRVTRVLRRLEAWVRDKKAREYRFVYKMDEWTGEPLLVSVRECGPLGRCRPSTRFEWTSPFWEVEQREGFEAPEDMV